MLMKVIMTMKAVVMLIREGGQPTDVDDNADGDEVMCTGSGGGEDDDETETSCEIDKPRSIAQAGSSRLDLLSFAFLCLADCLAGYLLLRLLLSLFLSGVYTVLSCPSHIVVHELYGSGGGGGGGGRGRRSTGEIGGGER